MSQDAERGAICRERRAEFIAAVELYRARSYLELKIKIKTKVQASRLSL